MTIIAYTVEKYPKVDIGGLVKPWFVNMGVWLLLYHAELYSPYLNKNFAIIVECQP